MGGFRVGKEFDDYWLLQQKRNFGFSQDVCKQGGEEGGEGGGCEDVGGKVIGVLWLERGWKREVGLSLKSTIKLDISWLEK